MNAPATIETARYDDVLRIAVLRGGGLGDLVLALPALDALAATYPEAEIVLLGTPAHRALLQGRSGPVARVEVLPHARGVHGADAQDDPPAVSRFVRRMIAEDIDLACQLHGGGRFSNPFVLALRARHTVGTQTPDAAPLERTIPYLYYQHEAIRWLEAVSLAGATPVGEEPRLAVSPSERMRGLALVGDPGQGLAVLHPGATDPRRRWPAERFAEVAVHLADQGMGVVVVGDGDDAAVADGIARAATDRAGRGIRSLAGRLSLSELVGLLAVADVFVGNDSGPRHLAQAVGTPTAAVFWVGNLINAGPLARARHRVQLSWTTHCPVCGRDVTQVGWTAPRCAHDVSFVADVAVEDVLADVVDLVSVRARTAPPPGP